MTCENGRARCLDRLVFATGFGSPYDAELLRQRRAESDLQSGYRGAPVLDDETLAWRTETGERSRVLVTGKLAEGTVGPFAGNIPGARRAAERIVERHPTGEPVAKPV